MKKEILILGAGFAGLELATRLSREVPDEVHVTLVDQSDAFMFGFSKLDILFGKKSRHEVKHYYRDISKPSVDFRQETVLSIDPGGRKVNTNENAYEPDVLVVSLGAGYKPDATPGFVEGGHEYYTVEGAERLRDELPSITKGTVVVATMGVPFKCPPAPFEGALLLHDYFVDRGVRDAIELRTISPLPSPIPVSPDTSKAIVAAMDARDIRHLFEERVASLDPSTKIAALQSGEEVPYEMLIGIPMSCVSEVVERSGLTKDGVDGWIHVDPRNLSTPYEGVYALGDVADAPVPRAGVFAENAARAVADDIVARVRDGSFDVPFEGRGSCYIEFGGGNVGKVDADFLSGPSPVAPFYGPSLDFARDKEEFGRIRRERWFDS